jgi:hypothetical protein
MDEDEKVENFDHFMQKSCWLYTPARKTTTLECAVEVCSKIVVENRIPLLQVLLS